VQQAQQSYCHFKQGTFLPIKFRENMGFVNAYAAARNMGASQMSYIELNACLAVWSTWHDWLYCHAVARDSL
jgi:hypothetical protein